LVVLVPFFAFLPAKDKAGDIHGRLAEVVLVEPVLVDLWLWGGMGGRGHVGGGVDALRAGQGLEGHGGITA